MRNEPSLTVGAISAVTAALIAVAVAFGLPLTADQQQAILIAVATAGPIVVGWVVRSRVTPSANVVAYVPRRAAGADDVVLAGEASSAPTGTEIDVSV
jgi:hypothetical protein